MSIYVYESCACYSYFAVIGSPSMLLVCRTEEIIVYKDLFVSLTHECPESSKWSAPPKYISFLSPQLAS